MPRAGDKMNTESFEVVIRIAQGVDFKLATIARAGIYVPYGKGATESLKDFILQAPRGATQRVISLRRRLGFYA